MKIKLAQMMGTSFIKTDELINQKKVEKKPNNDMKDIFSKHLMGNLQQNPYQNKNLNVKQKNKAQFIKTINPRGESF